MKPNTGLLFALPAILVLCILIAYPVVYTGYLSVTDDQGRFVGTEHFAEALRPRVTTQALWNTLWWVSGSIVFQVSLGVAAAILLNQRFFGRGLLRSIALVPWVIPGIVAATVWAWMLHTEFGIINAMLIGAGAVDEPVGWLTRGNTVLPALIAINVWKLFPFVAIMVLAGLQAIPNELYEAARVDGARYWQEIRYVMLPQIWTVIAAVTLLLVIWGLNAITIIYTITKGGPANRTLITPIQIFRLGFENVAFGPAAALSVIFFAIVMAIVAVYLRIVTNRPGDVQ